MEKQLGDTRKKSFFIPRINLPSSIPIFKIAISYFFFLEYICCFFNDSLKVDRPNYFDEPYNKTYVYALEPEKQPNLYIRFLPHDYNFTLNQKINLSIYTSPTKDIEQISVNFSSTNSGIVTFKKNVTIQLKNVTQPHYLELTATKCGRTVIFANASYKSMVIDTSNAFARISVRYSSYLDYLSDVVGWVYFVAWSVSFYPQIILNWRRKSVIGLHFDFLALNTVGFFLYAIFNIGFFWIPTIQQQYNILHPYGINPVQLNDVIFSIHAFLACNILIVQCFIYDRGDQKISKSARTLLGSFVITGIIMLILTSTTVISWINFLYFLSYIKLLITLIKYIPQAYFNYLRKSTSGWSIGNILLDFTGGILSIGQMFILSFNYNDWGSIFGDPTKFGLGFFSVCFDIFFMLQHYVWYKSHSNYQEILETEDSLQSSSTSSLRSSTYGAV